MNNMIEKIWQQDMNFTCKPLDSYKDILMFLQNPPAWRSLCKELKQHSEYALINMQLNKNITHNTLENPQPFCHYDPDADIIPSYERKQLPKTLVCHDMANGYHDDSMIDGTGHYEAYTFYNWGGIDIFCYFSHHLITIPPLGWINVGHAHGVKVIGTIITEWKEGAAFWDNMFESENMLDSFTNALVAIAKTLKFDGWLLNIENKISQPKKLLEFVHNFHRLLHQELIDPVLIWYDSVTVDGHLTWQNALNEKNKDFFDACDGIFTNYSWTPNDVVSSALMAGNRLTDVFIGIDVWGRNFFGGGQFNTQKAVRIAHLNGCSLAIFAPAWTHEAICQDGTSTSIITMGKELSYYEQFLLRDRALWGSLWPYLNTKLPCSLPFQTSFCRGQGIKRTLYGEVLCPVPWYNLRHMHYQPNSSQGGHGYILSTEEAILTAIQEIKVMEKGILKHTDTISTETKENFCNEKSTSENTLQVLSLTTIQGDNTIDHDSQEEIPVKIRIKVSKHLLHLKSRRLLSEETDSEPSRGRSRAQMSINLGSNTPKIRYSLAYVPEELECLEPYLADSFIGGSCLKVNPNDEISQEHRNIRIFHCDFYCEDSLIVCVVTKPVPGYLDQYLKIKLSVKDGKNNDIDVVLIGRNVPPTSRSASSSSDVINVYPVNVSSPDLFTDLRKYMLLDEPGAYVPVENCYGWHVWYYEVSLPKSRITSINCCTGLSQGPILLGYLGLCQRIHKGSNNDT